MFHASASRSVSHAIFQFDVFMRIKQIGQVFYFKKLDEERHTVIHEKDVCFKALNETYWF